MPEPIITPAKWLRRDSFPPGLQGCSTAVLGFLRFYQLTDKLALRPFPKPLFSHLNPVFQFTGQAAGRRVLALDGMYGGPLCATVLEELAYYGIKRAIGYGYAGSLTRNVPVGQIVLAEEALVSDGTAREYLPAAELAYPDDNLARLFYKGAVEAGTAIHGTRVWTTDALYREYPEKIARWRDAGAEIVNLDTGHFYAVSQVVGMAAVYACVISDCVEGPVWEDGFARIPQAMSDLQDLVVRAVRGTGPAL